MVVWTLKKGLDRRFRLGHPWVFSNELAESPKGVRAGELIELRDAMGNFLAFGYGHPNSLISFRELSRSSADINIGSADHLLQRFVRAAELRRYSGLDQFSHRLIFGEADFLPGLIIDRYRLSEGSVFVVQAHTAGIDSLQEHIASALQKFAEDSGPTSIIFKNDVKFRELEGLKIEEPKVAFDSHKTDFSAVEVLIKASNKNENVKFNVDLMRGQKTGFFLDQAMNIKQAIVLAKSRFSDNQKIKILDLCCYVGQWSAQFANEFGKNLHVTMFDASQKALDIAGQNVGRHGVDYQLIKGDVLEDLKKLPTDSFDIVICDPPAFIKSRKEIAQGQHAYMKLNSEAIRLCSRAGLYVTCSCSNLLTEEAFIESIQKGSGRARKTISWVARGSMAPDHPIRLEFDEGKYLKSWFGFVF